MSDMNAAVVLKMIDDLSRPARQASVSVRGLVKDLEKLRSLSGSSTGKASRQFENLTKEMKKSQKAAASLHQTMSRPMTNGFRNATTGINSVTTAANRAANAVSTLNRRMRSGGGNNNVPRNPSGGNRGGGHGSVAHGGFMSGLTQHIGRAALHVGVYEAATHGAELMTEGVKTGLEQAFDRQNTVAMLKMQGETPQAIAAAMAQSRNMAKSIPTFTSAQHLEAIAELRPALLGGLEEATKLAPMFQQATAVLEAVKLGAGKKALGGVDTHGEALDMVRALEIGGLTTHKGWTENQIEANMQKYVNGMTKAIVGMNGQIGAKDFHSAFKFSRGDSVNWSPEFATQILPTLMNELKKGRFGDASQTGNALKSMSRVVMDGIMSPDAANKWDHLGMFAPDAMTHTKKGVKKNGNYIGGAMLGADMWQSNPFDWVQQYLLPHMKENGVDLGNRKSVVAALGGLFGNRVANHIAQILAIQQDQIRKDQDNIKRARGSTDLGFLMSAHPTTRMQVLSAGVKDLLGALGDTAFSGSMRAMKGVTDWSHHLSETIGNSAYVKSLGGHFDAAVAGLFGQGMGRKGFANGEDKGYYNAAAQLAGGFRRLTSAMGANFRFLEEKGAFRIALAGLGGVFDGLATSANVARGAAQALSDALNSSGAKQVGNALAGAIDSVLAAAGLDKKTREDIHGPGRRNQGLIKSMQPPAPEAPAPVQRGRNGAKVPSLWNPIKSLFSGPAPLNSAGSVFGLGGFADMDSQITQPITSAMSSVTPMIAKTGGDAMAALASGITGNAGSVQAAMGQVLANLSTIASAGVTVPVKLETAAAEAQLASMMSRASRLGSLSRAPQFSPALSDIGN